MPSLSTAAANAALQALKDLTESGSLFLVAFRRAGGNQVVLAQHRLFSSPSGGTMPLAGTPITFTQTSTPGDAVLFNGLIDGFPPAPFELTVGGPGSGADIELSPHNTINAGEQIRLDSLTLSFS